MEREDKIRLLRIVFAGVLLLAAQLSPTQGVLRLCCFLAPYLIAGYDVLKTALTRLLRGRWLEESFLMTLATVGALAIGEYPEAVFVMIFFQIGELFEDIASEKSRRSVESLMDVRPDSANLERDGKCFRVHPAQVECGEVIVVRPGEKIPLDGTVIEGSSALNTSALTGESLPREVLKGDYVLSGSVNLTGVLRVRTQKLFADSTAAKILELVENAAQNKAKSESFIRKFAKWYTPAMVLAAILIAVVPPLVLGNWLSWIRRALVVLVISCPCALVVSVPLTFFCGIGAASRHALLIKGGNVLDALAKTKTVAFDKTGTLTQGVFTVQRIHAEGCDDKTLLRLAAQAEQYSVHPIAACILAAYGDTPEKIPSVEELPGFGVRAEIGGNEVLLGKKELLSENHVAVPFCEENETVLYLAQNGVFLGYIVVGDTPKADSAEAIRELKKLGVTRTVMLTGDRTAVGKTAAARLGIDEVYAELLPADKVRILSGLKEKSEGTLLFAGDGVNDAPVLACADVGAAMGALGSDAAVEAADVVLMDDHPSRLPQLIRLARNTHKIAVQNIILTLLFKAAVLALNLFGLTALWTAVFADVGVLILAVLNAVRAGKSKKIWKTEYNRE